MKRLLSVILSLICVLTAVGTPLCVLAAENRPEAIVEQNPLYSGKSIAASVLKSDITKDSATKKINGVTYYSKGRQLYNRIKNAFEERSGSVTVHYFCQTNYMSIFSSFSLRDLINELFLNATDDELSVSSTDGDYIRWAVQQMTFGTFDLDKTVDGKYYYTFELRPEYYDTAEEEKLTDKAVQRIVDSIDTAALSDYQIIRKVHDIICAKTTYCYDALEEPYENTYACTAYGALVKGSCVCQGYAVAFYRICKELGYNVRFVSSDPNKGCHAWNIVELDGKYYFVDTTWDDQIMDEQLENYEDDAYFLVNYESVQRHDSSLQQHLLQERYYNTAYFNETYRSRFAEEDYDAAREHLFSQYTVSVNTPEYAYSGKMNTPKVTVTDTDGETLTEGEDYRLSYSRNKNAGAARVCVSGCGAYACTKAYRPFTVLPPKAGPLSLNGARTDTTIPLRWDAVNGGVTGYSVEQLKNGVWKTVRTTDAGTTSCMIGNLASAGKYRFRVRAYKTVYRRAVYGTPSREYVTATRPKKVTGVSVKAGKKSAVLRWKKRAASYYEIQYSLNKSMKNAKTVKASAAATSKTIKGLKRNRRCYFRVRAVYRYINGAGNESLIPAEYSAKKSAVIR